MHFIRSATERCASTCSPRPNLRCKMRVGSGPHGTRPDDSGCESYAGPRQSWSSVYGGLGDALDGCQLWLDGTVWSSPVFSAPRAAEYSERALSASHTTLSRSLPSLSFSDLKKKTQIPQSSGYPLAVCLFFPCPVPLYEGRYCCPSACLSHCIVLIIRCMRYSLLRASA